MLLLLLRKMMFTTTALMLESGSGINDHSAQENMLELLEFKNLATSRSLRTGMEFLGTSRNPVILEFH